ncbi:hypothetical protein BGP75_13930 [Motiliproteus sp. MSK22-1]|nr:hypothetical protein BGP75_13930 [Motiliproteus sp. MSK22-1]
MRTEDAVNYYGGRGNGGVRRLAAALGITHGAVCQWGEYLPALQAYRLEEITQGHLKSKKEPKTDV